jgi:sugar phosphate isomerase/epimerase
MIGLSRRQFLTTLAATGAAVGMGAALPGRTAAAGPLGLPVGIQLYTVKDEVQRDVEGTLRALAAIGYREVESIALSFGGWDTGRIGGLLRSLGIGWRSTHTSLPDLLAKGDALMAEARAAGIEFLICAAPFVKDPASRLKPLAADDPMVRQYGQYASYIALLNSLTLDDWKWNAEQFNRMGEKAKQAGLRFGYHNHSFEFRDYDGTIAYDELLRLTDPGLVTMELDCGWVVAAGRDPVDYLTRHKDRYSLLHVKDLKPGPRGGLEAATTEVGRGTIDWKPIFAAAGKAGIKAYYVEQEPPYERPVLESARISHDFLAGLKVS